MHRKDHFIVCGHSILAINTILQLNQRGQNVTVISNLPEDDIKQLEQRLGDNADVIPGDSNDSSVLKKAESIAAEPFWRWVITMQITRLLYSRQKIWAVMSKQFSPSVIAKPE